MRAAVKRAIPQKAKPRKAKTSFKTAPAKAFIEAAELPLHYDTTRLALIARDPHWMYAYWEITPQTLHAARDALGQGYKKATYILRVHDITNTAFRGSRGNRFFDVVIEPSRQSGYIELTADNATYCADLLLRSRSGKQFLVARSNNVTTPAAEVSRRLDQTWVKPVSGNERMPRIVQNIIRGESPDFAVLTAQPAPAPDEFTAQAKQSSTQQVGEFSHEGNDHPPSPYVQAPEAVREMCVQPGVSGKFAGQAYIPAQPSPLGSSDLVNNREEFPFAIETQLIVRGRTAPGAQVWLNDQSIALTCDGTFMLQFDMQDGEAPLKFRALSVGGAMHKDIQTSIVRTPTVFH